MGLQMPWITIWLWLVIDSCVKDLNCCYFSSLVLHSWPYFFHESGLDSDLTLASQVQYFLWNKLVLLVQNYSTGTGMRRHLESKHFDGKVICGFESIVFLNQ